METSKGTKPSSHEKDARETRDNMGNTQHLAEAAEADRTEILRCPVCNYQTMSVETNVQWEKHIDEFIAPVIKERDAAISELGNVRAAHSKDGSALYKALDERDKLQRERDRFKTAYEQLEIEIENLNKDGASLLKEANRMRHDLNELKGAVIDYLFVTKNNISESDIMARERLEAILAKWAPQREVADGGG